MKLKIVCPSCSAALGSWTAIAEDDGTSPSENDVTVCLYCSAVLQFTKTLQLRMASVKSIEQVTLELSRAQFIVKQFNSISNGQES